MKGEFFKDNLSIFSSVKPLFNNVRLMYKSINIPETELAPLVLRGETLLRLLSSTCNCESAVFPPNTSKDLVDIHMYIQLEKSKFLIFHAYVTTCFTERQDYHNPVRSVRRMLSYETRMGNRFRNLHQGTSRHLGIGWLSLVKHFLQSFQYGNATGEYSIR